MSDWQMTYDPEARAVYIKLTDEMVFLTRRINDDVNIDLDIDANLIGIEILNVPKEPRVTASARGGEDIMSDYDDDPACSDCGGWSDEMMSEGTRTYCNDCASRRLEIPTQSDQEPSP